MTTKDTDTHNPMPAAEPLALRLIDGLGPLPEPAAEAVMDLCADHEGPVEAWQYLPADAMLYTANQMRDYASAEMARVVAALKPLTDDQIDALAMDKDGLPNSHLEFARAVECAHGICDA